jgi:hypothetical protein
MFNFLRGGPTTPRLSSLDYLIALVEEQNKLLRELIAQNGRPSGVPKASPNVVQKRVYTDKDVVQVTRSDYLRQEVEEAASKAPWRRPGPASDPIAPIAGPVPTADSL